MDRRRPNIRLQEARALKGWSQEDLAAQLGTTFETVSRWERGIMIPNPYFRTRLCAAFGMEAEALGLLAEPDRALHSSLSAAQVVVAWAAADKDHVLVEHMLSNLQTQGILTVSPWLLGRRGPAHKQDNLDEAIRATQLVLLILSPHAPASRDIRTTAQLAQLYDRPLAAFWIAGDHQQECFPSNVPLFLRIIDARTADKQAIVRDVLDLVEQFVLTKHAKTEETPLPVETIFSEKDFPHTFPEVPDMSVGEDALLVEPRPLSMLHHRNRQRFLDKVQAFWIAGVLEHSIHDIALIRLGLSALPEAVEQPWRFVLAQPDHLPFLFDTGTTITQVYDEVCGELLILGEPGAGKTTLLLELARDLIARARRDETLPLPVVFNLSSWSEKKLPLAAWFVEELHLKYQIPRQLGTEWVSTDSLLPLLDGMDEVAAEHREACIKAINAFRWEHGLLPTVVCSRSAEYFMLPQRIVLHSAVMVQPLSPAQIEAYLEQAGESLHALRAALLEDAELRELASTPLMLSILTLAYQGKQVEDFVHGSAQVAQQVFRAYVERMLHHRGVQTRYTPQQTLYWLSWLARQLVQEHQTEFYIERMQPYWLPEPWSRLRRYNTLVRLGIASVAGLIVCLFLGLTSGLLAGFAFGISKGDAIGGLVTGLLGGLIVGLLGGLVVGLLIGLTSRINATIQPAEVVVWSWRKLIETKSIKGRLRVGITSGLILGLLIGLLVTATSPTHNLPLILFAVVVVVLIVVVIIAVVGVTAGVTSGISTKLQLIQQFTTPNQGMRRSLQNSIRIAIVGNIIGGSICVLAFSFLLLLIKAQVAGGPVILICLFLFLWSLGGTLSGLIVALPNGGIALIQHAVLRLLLWRKKCVPWRYSRFLDFAVERVFLRKVGGGYIFIHRLLLDYFASLNTS